MFVRTETADQEIIEINQVRTIERRIKYRFERLKKIRASEGIVPAVISGWWQVVSVVRVGILQSWWRLRYPGGLIERDTEVGPMLLSYRDKGVSKQLLQQGIREPLLVDLLRKELEPGMHGYDIGANIGYYVLLEDSIVGISGEITACEPTPGAASVLARNVFSYCSSKVDIQRVAVSNRIGEIRMSYSDTWNVSRIVSNDLPMPSSGTITVPVTTLDQLHTGTKGGKIDFIRMDIEGHELSATEGMAKILSSGSPRKLFIEVHNMLFDSEGKQVSTWLNTLFEYGLRPRALTMGADIRWVDDREVFVKEVIVQKRSCVHVYLER